MPLANAMAALTGTQRLVDEGVEGFEDDETNLTNALNKKEIHIAEVIVIKEMFSNFIFRRMDEAERLVRQYKTVRFRYSVHISCNLIHFSFFVDYMNVVF